MYLQVVFVDFADDYSWSRPTVYGDLPPARDGHSACVLNLKMYIFGGYEEVVREPLACSC